MVSKGLEPSCLLLWGYTTHCPEYSWEEEEVTRSRPAARLVSIAAHHIPQVRTSATLARPLTHVDVGTTPRCAPPAAAGHQSCHLLLQSALTPTSVWINLPTLKKTHAENKQPALHCCQHLSVQLDDTGAEEIAAVDHVQTSLFCSIPC